MIESSEYFEAVLSKQICKVKRCKHTRFSINSQKTKFMTPGRWKDNKFSPNIRYKEDTDSDYPCVVFYLKLITHSGRDIPY